MDLQLKGKRALVSGGSGGIGAVIAQTLAAEGARVAVHGRTKDSADPVADAITKAGGEAHPIGGALDANGAGGVFQSAVAALGGVDVLVNVAGKFTFDPWDAMSQEAWTETVDTNLLSAVRLMGFASPGMRASGWGRIINVASGAALKPYKLGPDYAAAKAGLLAATVSAAHDFAGTGVTVNAVSPGVVRTPPVEKLYRAMAEARGWGTADDWEALERHIVAEDAPNPVGRLARPEEVADVVVFLASPRAAYVMGVNWRVDGGWMGTVS